MAPLDPLTREVLRNALLSVADTMAVTIVRTGRSAIIKDGMDFSTALFNGAGEQVAQGLTLPSHLGSMVPALEAIRREFAGDVEPGDIFANNDPYDGGSHLPDIFLFKPIFNGPQILAWLCAVAHQTDIGGRVPGGVVCDNTEIFQEGLQIPPVKLYEAGKLNTAVWRILMRNVRVPDMVLGDVQAQLAAIHVGEKELALVIEEYGPEALARYMDEIVEVTERQSRTSIRSLPQGTWEYTDYVDNDGIELEPIAIRARITIANDEIAVDFTGTSKQAAGSINPNIHYTRSHVYAAFKCVLDAAIDSNSGFFRVFKINAPPGSFVNPQHPAPVAARGLAGFRICQAIFGALAQAMPGRIPASWGGGEAGLIFGGYREGKAWVHVDLINDGPRGGGPDFDGADGLSAPIHNMANIPIENVEADCPLLIERYELVPDSGGAGRYRGGLAILRDVRMLADKATFQLRSDRCDFLPYGLEGGQPGTPTRSWLNPQCENRPLAPKSLMTLRAGDVVRLVQAGGGGYGEPLLRDPAAVLDDIRQEKITRAYAEREYAVVVGADLAVDAAATERLRRERQGDGAPRPAATRNEYMASAT